MTNLKTAFLPNRGVISVTGADGAKLLQGIVTADMERLKAVGDALHCGLLSPQGKILFDFFVLRTENGFLIETGKAEVPDLVKRLSMYKLRADVEIVDRCADFSVAAVWGEGAVNAVASSDCAAFVDPRRADLGGRLLLTLANDQVLKELGGTPAAKDDFHAHRIGLGVPEAGKDFKLGDTFPHEALYDQLGSVSFTKGCFVGQEVVSRMQHRGTARKRVVIVVGDEELPATGAEVTAGAARIGALGSVSGSRGLALVRLDRASEAITKGDAIRVGDVSLGIEIAQWASYGLGGVSEADNKE
ncbi:MAG: folate-binding protein [Alphaproteobacteria bacterium]|nr:folate-binding protein [Alphaproteobacteria bacterium]